ncbi:hypothetical protein [Chroococcidiopsis sp.]|uniref:hypothetical protein n=1 Tax=Chroococcidiopsis sp. TaxID=3088168 RepID=UPI003F3CB783
MASVTKAQLEQLLDETRKEVQETVMQLQALERRNAKLEVALYDAQERLFYLRGHALVYMPEVLGKEQQF